MDQIPRGADLLAPAVDALLGDLTGARRAARERYAQSGPTGGRFGDILRGWRGQAEVIRARLTKEVMATRLDRCGAQELKDLAKSEYFAELPSDPQKAVGEATLSRTVTNTNSAATANFTAGVVPAGTRIKRAGNTLNFIVPLLDAEYQLVEAITCGADDTSPPINAGGGNFTHTQRFTVKLSATREGPHANAPSFFAVAAAPVTIASKLFDPLFTVSFMTAAGGTLGIVDDQIRALARAMATGSNGPTARAAIAGALTNSGVRRAAYFEDPVNAIGHLFVADESWASSSNYCTQILQALRARPWIGWGCRVLVNQIGNIGVSVAPTILLRSPDFVAAETDITENVKQALLKYFDERPDFYTWTLNAIGAVIGGADSRILACTAVSVADNFGDLIAAVDDLGVVTGSEPAPTITLPGGSAFHYQLIGQAVNPTYVTPGA